MRLDNQVDFFNDFYRRYIVISEDRLRQVSKKVNFDFLFPSVSEYIHGELLAISRMVLIFELHCYRENDSLKGDTSEERYRSFCEITSTEEFHQYIMKSYPVLEYLFNQRMDHAIKCVESIINSFINDRHELERIFGKEFNKIYDIQIGNGDMHELGKTIAILTGDFGKIVYKSRDLYNDLALNTIIDFLNSDKNIKFQLKKNLVLCKDGYGWQEFIETKNCKSYEEVDRFYYRLGCYLAVFFIFNSGDMHYENIITDGEFPRIIDTETLVTLSKFKNIMDVEAFHNYPMDNVLSTCFLPLNNKAGILDVDLSGLSGGNLESQKIKDYHIENYATDNMKLVRKTVHYEMDKTNIPKINDEYVDILAWREQFLMGFDEAMNSFSSNKEMLIKCIAQSDVKYSHQRQLFRNTYAYAKFLETSCHPSYLSSFEKRKDLFEKMRNPDAMDDKRIEHEISLLNDGYIPAYYSTFEGRSLYSGKQVIQEDFFNQTGADTVKYKIATLSPETIRLQKHIINLSYMTLVKDIISRPKANEDNTTYYENCLLGAGTILNSIGENILINPDNGLYDLYIIRLCEEYQSLQGLELSLYEGGGLMWALYSYARETANQQLLETCLSMFKLVEQRQDNSLESLSVYSGSGSVVYLFFNLYVDTGNPEYYSLCMKHLKAIDEKIEEIESIDYMHGISGYVVLLSKMLSYKKDEYLLSVFNKACKVLESMMVTYKVDTAGIAHGAAGVAMAISYLPDQTDGSRILRLIEDVLEEEKKNIDPDNVFWCRGIGGMVYAKAQILTNMQHMKMDPIYLKISNELDEDVNHLLNLRFKEMDNLCLCHGLYGHYDVLISLLHNCKEVLREDKVKMLEEKIEEAKKDLVVITNKKLWLTCDYMLETFMLGSSGPAYAMLRLHNDRHPSILSLDII